MTGPIECFTTPGESEIMVDLEPADPNVPGDLVGDGTDDRCQAAGAGSRSTGLSMAYKLLMMAQQR